MKGTAGLATGLFLAASALAGYPDSHVLGIGTVMPNVVRFSMLSYSIMLAISVTPTNALLAS